MFVATANDRATEKDCLFLELSLSLKEIKINTERFFFFFLKKNNVEKKSIPSQHTLLPSDGGIGFYSGAGGQGAWVYVLALLGAHFSKGCCLAFLLVPRTGMGSDVAWL